VAVNLTTKDSYLLRYSLSSGSLTKTLLDNPYRDTPLEGFYQISNLQLIADKYLMVHTSSGHIIFFDAYNPAQGIKGEVTIESNWSQLGSSGYYVVPQIGGDQPTDPTTNVLLQLCNAIRSLKMTWATNQVQVCQAHADWCVANSVFQHEGPGGNSVGDRNHAVGIYAGISENITIVMTATSDTEQTNAFNNWCESPHHYEGIIRGGNKYMSFAEATYPESVTQIGIGIGMYDPETGGYTTEPGVREVQEWERGKLKIYVQNFIWY
jgi:Cysteine-rich secretory protein family.